MCRAYEKSEDESWYSRRIYILEVGEKIACGDGSAALPVGVGYKAACGLGKATIP
jgi:hypothetical protein